MTQVIVLNGGSSSGKSSIARALQQVLPSPWLSWSIDDLVDALPRSLAGDGDGSGPGIEFGPTGEVAVGDVFSKAQVAWLTGIAAMVRAGERIILDDVFLAGGASQERMRTHLAGLEVLWVGVRCSPQIAAKREAARGDRVTGMAALQADAVHQGVAYDVTVDSGAASALACAHLIAAVVDDGGGAG